jgi:SHS family lactate transporter-like MFS transporter
MSGARTKVETTASNSPTSGNKGQFYAVLAGFLGWTFDAFDFFILTFVLAPIAKEFGTGIPALALTITASLATRWIGAIVFGLFADRYGRRIPLIVNILYFSLIEVLSGLAPSYKVFFFLRLLYGVGMGGEWGVGASLAMESVPVRWRGLVSGFLQEGYALGFLLAAGVYRLVYPHWGWRPLFFIGGLPALLTLLVRAKVREPEAWHRSRTDWTAYRQAIFRNWKRFAYLVVLLAMTNFISQARRTCTRPICNNSMDSRRSGPRTSPRFPWSVRFAADWRSDIIPTAADDGGRWLRPCCWGL